MESGIKKSNIARIVLLLGIILSVVGIVDYNANAPVTVVAQTVNTPQGNVSQIIKECTPFPDTPYNPFAGLCQYSNNQVNNSAGSCSVGQSYSNGACISIPQTSCPAGTVISNGLCVTSAVNNSCPSGSVLASGVCVSNTQPTKTCPTGATLTNGVCVTPVVNIGPCPNGGIPTNNVCPNNIIPLPQNTTLPPDPTNPNTLPKETILITPVISYVDNSGVITLIQADSLSLQLGSWLNQPFSFVAPQNTNIDISRGKVSLGIKITTGNPNELVTANGTLWVTLNGVQLHPLGVNWFVSGTSDSKGVITAQFQLPTSRVSQYDFIVADHQSQLSSGTNPLIFSLSNIKMQNQLGQSYSTTGSQQFFKTSLDYDQFMVIQKNLQGIVVRMYPTDDSFSLQSNWVVSQTFPYQYTSCLTKGSCYTYTKMVTEYTAPAQPAGSAALYLINTDGSKTAIGNTPVVKVTVNSNGGQLCSGNTFSPCITQPVPCITNCFNISTNGMATVGNVPRGSDIEIIVTGGQANGDYRIHTDPATQHDYLLACTINGCTSIK